jgi:signal transduction histidine kinase
VLERCAANAHARAELASLLQALVLCVADRMGASEEAPPPDRSLRSEIGRQLLAELRAEIVDRWSAGGEPPPAEDVVAVWRALEMAHRDLGPARLQRTGIDWGRDFTDRLGGPAGLELVVEVAHDLRSPLTSILFLAETLQRGQSGRVNELQHRQLGLIYSAALGLGTLASNVMELARGGTRLADDEPAPFSVVDVMESVADIVRPMAEEKGLAIRLLPPVADHRLGPAQALSRVLLNLTTNALKFTEEGLVEIVAKELDEEQVEFSVRDTGRGVNPGAVHTLFMPFRPGPDASRMAFSGTGLGLALCQKLVRAMGSELRYETRPDWGTRFFFALVLPAVGG